MVASAASTRCGKTGQGGAESIFFYSDHNGHESELLIQTSSVSRCPKARAVDSPAMERGPSHRLHVFSGWDKQNFQQGGLTSWLMHSS